MLISVVVIFYNQPQYVERALLSVTSQSHSDIEIIVVDDGSDYSIEEQVFALCEERIRLIRKENGGAGSARNRGVQEAKGEYIAFLDGDDVWLPNRIESIVEQIRASEYEVAMYSCSAFAVNRKGHILSRIRSRGYYPGEWINTSLVRPSCTVYHSAVFKEVGGFPEDMASNEDGAFNIVAASRFPVVGVDKPLVLYRVDDQGLARAHLQDFNSAVEILESKLNYIESRIPSDLFETYRERAKRDLLYGFLSCGNMKGARLWLNKTRDIFIHQTLHAQLALISCKIGINLYRHLRSLKQCIVYVRYSFKKLSGCSERWI